MEQWQKNHVTRNRERLVAETTCNQRIYNHLLAQRVLAKEDWAHIKSTNDPFEQAAILYDFAETRTDGFVEMAVALAKANQTGPCEIFMDGLAQHADANLIIDFVEKIRHLQDFVDGSEMKRFKPKIKNRLTSEQYNSLFETSQQMDASSASAPTNTTTHKSSAFFTDNVSRHLKQRKVEADHAEDAIAQLDVVDASSHSPAPTSEKITFSRDEQLGKGSGDTFVYKGSFGSPARPVAVKVVSGFRDKNEALDEIKKLIACDSHENIVRYLDCSEPPDNSILIALELCDGTLEEVINKKEFRNHALSQVASIDDVDICRQIASGVEHIHAKQIIHRDLKPNNVLIKLGDGKLKIKISDFGISRVLDHGRNSRTFTSAGGSNGWMAPETLRFLNDSSNDDVVMRMDRKTDVFTLGCIFYYVLTNGKHIFGDILILRNSNIWQGQPKADANHPSLHVRCNLPFLLDMVANETTVRPDSPCVLGHPIFWTSKEKLQFLVDVSNFVEGVSWDPNNPPNMSSITDEKLAKKIQCISKLENAYRRDIIDGRQDGWFELIKGDVNSYLKSDKFTRNYYWSVMGLVRVIRNLNNHYENKTLPENIKLIFGTMPDGYIDYWLNIFPLLIHNVREAFSDFKDEFCMKSYYKNY